MPDNDARNGGAEDPTQPLPPVDPGEPTQPLPPVDPGEPTQVLPPLDATHARDVPPSVAPPGSGIPGPPVAPERSRAARVAVWIAVALLVILALSVLASLLTRSGLFAPGPSVAPSTSVPASAPSTPTASENPSPSPSETPSPTPTEPAPAGPAFTSFTSPANAICLEDTAVADVTLEWTSTGASRAWVGVATDNAKAAPYEEVETSGTATLPFPCANESQKYTVTLEGAGGALVHHSVTVQRQMP